MDETKTKTVVKKAEQTNAPAGEKKAFKAIPVVETPTTKTDKPKKTSEDKNVCEVCGKTLTRESSVEGAHGAYCASLLARGLTRARRVEIVQDLTREEVPVVEDGPFAGQAYVKVAALHKTLQREGIPVNRMVRAFGGDGVVNEPLHPLFTPVYCGNSRWLHPWCASPEGKKFLRELGGRKAKAPKKDDLADMLA
jgi:hypothetical protein